MASLFADVQMAPRDPILGLSEQFNADTNPKKVNLAVGVYYDENGKLPLLACVTAAERQLNEAPQPRGYLPIDGIAAYDAAVQGLVFGADSAALQERRIATIQGLGGTGALKVGADFLRQVAGCELALISDPSWENHRALFTNAGFEVSTYPYYDPNVEGGINFEGMLQALQKAPSRTVVVLHACCHNPTGYDLSAARWSEVVKVVQSRGLIAFLDLAYQGFAEGVQEDGQAVRQFVDAGVNFFCASSFSKSFSLYGERVGALSAVCADANEAARVLSQLKIVIRTNYSNPPTHGAKIVATVLQSPALREQWEQELSGMRGRIKSMRRALVDQLGAAGVDKPMTHVLQQRGMFSYSGLTKEQMQRLRTQYGVYGLDSGRICVAALNERNLDYVVRSMAAACA